MREVIGLGKKLTENRVEETLSRTVCYRPANGASDR